MTHQAVRARLTAPGFQEIHVTVRGGYRPRSISARAGLPLRLVFHRDEDATCSERVVFSSPHLDRHLAPHAATVVDLPGQPPGEVRFTCAMGRYRGVISIAGETAERSALGRSRFQPLAAGVGTAAVVAAGLLSAIVVPTVFALILAVSVAVVVAGWLTLSARRSTGSTRPAEQRGGR